MIRHKEMQQLMNNHVVPERVIKVEQLGVEIQMAVSGTGSPLFTHRADTQPGHLNIQLVGPAIYLRLECTLLYLAPSH